MNSTAPRKLQNIIILDANFILLPFQFKIDFFEEITFKLEGSKRFIIFKQIFDELEAKKNREKDATKFQQQLSAGIEYLNQRKDKYDLLIIDKIKALNETTDDFLITQSLEFQDQCKHLYLATNDSELRRKAKKSNINVIFLRQKKYLCFE